MASSIYAVAEEYKLISATVDGSRTLTRRDDGTWAATETVINEAAKDGWRVDILERDDHQITILMVRNP